VVTIDDLVVMADNDRLCRVSFIRQSKRKSM
jgi:hypothetical protein